MPFELFDNSKFVHFFTHSLYRNALNPVLLIDGKTGLVLDANPKAISELGLDNTIEEYNFCRSAAPDLEWENIIAQLTSQKMVVEEHKLHTPSGEIRLVRSHFHKLKHIVCCVSYDFTNIYQQIDLNALYKAVFKNATDAIMITSADNKILEINQAFEQITGYSKQDVAGKNPSLLSSKMHDESFYISMWDNITKHGFWQGEIWNRRKNGETYPEWLTINSIYDQQQNLRYRFAIFSDLTKQKQQEENLLEKTYYDSLTDLPNRILFYDRLQNALKLAARNNDKVSVLFVDLDQFNVINDTYGHHFGDKLLKAFAHRLKGLVRESDTVARYGADIFAITAQNTSTELGPQHLAETLLKELKEVYMIDGQELVVSACIGVSVFPDDSILLEDLVSIADQTLHSAKQAGPNNYQLYSAKVGKRLRRKFEIKEAIIIGIKNQEFYPVYQPIVCAKTGRLDKFEVLARWYSSVLEEQVSPAEFIPVAEGSGLIFEIGETIATKALDAILTINQQLNSHFGVAINRSVKELFHNEKNSIKNLEALVQSKNFPTEWLTVEITESSLIDEGSPQTSRLNQWRQNGAKIAIDDFGTGFSALSYLTQYPIDIVKIDGSFVRQIGHDKKSRHLVEAVIKLANTLQLTTIVEGVETEIELAFVQQCGADFIQGFYFSKPLTYEDALEFARLDSDG